jgi:hypothetical protein
LEEEAGRATVFDDVFPCKKSDVCHLIEGRGKNLLSDNNEKKK